MLAFLNRHLPLTHDQRNLFRQSQAVSHSETQPGASASTNDHGPLATEHRVLPNAEGQERTNSSSQIGGDGHKEAGEKEGGLRPGQIMLQGLSDGDNNGRTLTGRTYESRIVPQEREVFANICHGNVAILEFSL